MPTPGGFARRLAAGGVLAAALALPGASASALASASAFAFASASSERSGEPPSDRVPRPDDRDTASAAPRGLAPGAPKLRPDPPVDVNAPPEPARPPRPAPGTDPPTQQEWDGLLDRLAAHGARPVTDESGQAILDVDRQLVLTGGAEGLDALRSWGAEVAQDGKPGVYAVRSGGRGVAVYVLEREPAVESQASAPVTPPAFDAPPTLPRTGPPVANLTLIALGGAGIVCAGGLLVRCSPPPRRR